MPVELLEFHPSRLDEKVERLLLAEQMQLWIDAVVDVLEAELQWEEALKSIRGTWQLAQQRTGKMSWKHN